MKAVVAGYGSIGSRHARLLSELGLDVAVVSERNIDFPKSYNNLPAAIEKESPDYVVIANETSRHYDSLIALLECNYKGQVLVEKPLFHKVIDVSFEWQERSYVAYNLRYHPAIQRVKSMIKNERVLSVLGYVGQYLPDWRPGSDYRKSYSARKEKGGGVLRDLSHELDYFIWLFGSVERVCSIGGKYSSLDINSDDIFSIQMTAERCPIVTLQMNYLDRVGRRYVLINTDNHTIEMDLVKGNVIVDKVEESFAMDRDYTYRKMHKAVIEGNLEDICTIADGIKVMRLIEAIEQSSEKGVWVNQ